MVKHEFIIDPSLLDTENPVADIEAIRAYNPQRHEMEPVSYTHLTLPTIYSV